MNNPKRENEKLRKALSFILMRADSHADETFTDYPQIANAAREALKEEEAETEEESRDRYADIAIEAEREEGSYLDHERNN